MSEKLNSIKLPMHIALYLTHNEYKCYYQTVEQWLQENEDHKKDWLTPEELDNALKTGDVWELQWYPRTPVGFYRRRAASLKRLLNANYEEES